MEIHEIEPTNVLYKSAEVSVDEVNGASTDARSKDISVWDN